MGIVNDRKTKVFSKRRFAVLEFFQNIVCNFFFSGRFQNAVFVLSCFISKTKLNETTVNKSKLVQRQIQEEHKNW